MTTLTVPSRLNKSDLKIIRNLFEGYDFRIRREFGALCASATGNTILAHRLVSTVNGLISDRKIGNQP